MLSARFRRLTVALVVVSFLALSLLGCGGGQAPEPEATSEIDLIIQGAKDYLAAGNPPTISAQDVYNNVVVGKDPGYFLLSIRSPKHYAIGHVPGAVNIPYREIWKEENMAKIPKDKKIVVICYTGHTASQVTALLNMLGYEAYAMKFGMMGWTSDPEVLGISTYDCSNPPSYPVATEATEGGADNELPEVATGKTTAEEVILARAEAYLTSGQGPTISAADVYNNVVVAKDPDYFVLSIRSPDHYAKGHVEGSINIPWREIAKEENLKKLPKDKKIVVVCYTGHTASQTTMFLNLLGYEAYAMKFGMMGYNADPEVLNLAAFDCNPPNYPVEAGN